jgi:hypothetical protein
MGMSCLLVQYRTFQNICKHPIFVFPTENDAFPSSICGGDGVRSASGHTTPVGAIKNIVTDQTNGLARPAWGAEQLFQALDTMLSNKGLFPTSFGDS